ARWKEVPLTSASSSSASDGPQAVGALLQGPSPALRTPGGNRGRGFAPRLRSAIRCRLHRRERDLDMSEAARPVIGIIGGSGLYDIDGLTDKRWEKVESPFGAPSDELLFGTYEGQPLVFLPRHGRGHRLSPTDVNYRANIDALKRAGVTEVLSVSAVGSLKPELPPGTFVLVDQFIDRTIAREKSFFGPGLVAHVSMAHPVCRRLQGLLASAAGDIGIAHQSGGTYLAMEGPQFSTLAESN